MTDYFIHYVQNDDEETTFKNIGNTAEYKAWKTKRISLIQSCINNINACNAIIAKHTFRNNFGQKKYNSSDFSQQEKLSFNKNLDSIGEKIDKINDGTDFEKYYNVNDVSDDDYAKYSGIISYSNNTSKVY